MFNLARVIVLSTLLSIVNVRNPIVSGEKVLVVTLNKASTLRNQNGSIEIHVPKLPSGVYSAVSELYGDVLKSKNDVDLRWIAYENWTYSYNFEVDQADYENVRSVNLTFYGVDTVATIRLNNQVMGQTDNMFRRYTFDVLPYLQQENVLEIELMSPIRAAQQLADDLAAKNITAPPKCPHEEERGECHRNMLRKMQTSFGDISTLAAPSMGIWKPIYLEYYDVAILRDVDVAVRKTETLWTMDIRAILNTGIKEDFYGELMFYAPELLDQPVNVSRRLISHLSPVIDFKVSVKRSNVVEWWPNGYGVQKLYPLYFSVNCWLASKGPLIRSKSISTKSIRIGFRTIELVEDLDDHGRTFYFKVNDRPIFIKGANVLPAHILPELSDEAATINHILLSAKESNMNMIRVWGGGLYESDYFYSMADYYGLLVWQDMTFSKSTYPVTDDFVESIRREAKQNAKRIAYHPSLALIVTNNEIEYFLVKNKTDFGRDYTRLVEEYKQLFIGTIKYELNVITRNEFNPRPGPMMSTPSNGIEEGKRDISVDPNNPNYGDIHFWKDEKDGWDPNIYPEARFISEYGFQSLPMLSSWQRTCGPNDTIASLIKHRQHHNKGFRPMMRLIERHLPFSSDTWEDNIEALIYFSQVSQAMATKTATEVFRSQRTGYRTMGALYWQMNDVWVAPTYSSIDFYGNYKILYNWSREFLAHVAIIALYDSKNESINVTLVRDDITTYKDAKIYNITMNTYLWSQLFPQKTVTWQAIMDSYSIQKRVIPFSTIAEASFTRNNCFVEFVLTLSNDVVSRSFFFPDKIRKAVGITDPQLTYEIFSQSCSTPNPQNLGMYSITIRIRRPAVFVFIEISHPEFIKYKLSHNGFMQVEPVKTVQLEIDSGLACVVVTKQHIKVSTVNQFMKNAVGGNDDSDDNDDNSTIPSSTVNYNE